jgi:hypothetical protein
MPATTLTTVPSLEQIGLGEYAVSFWCPVIIAFLQGDPFFHRPDNNLMVFNISKLRINSRFYERYSGKPGF